MSKHKYLVIDNHVVGSAEAMVGEPPNGYTVFESEEPNAIGMILDGETLKQAPVVDTNISYGSPESIVTFWGTELFKKARIKGNKDPYLATQMGLAMVAEQRGDRAVLEGAIKSIEDILRKSAK